jgi:hypothetical protein
MSAPLEGTRVIDLTRVFVGLRSTTTLRVLHSDGTERRRAALHCGGRSYDISTHPASAAQHA